jgi:hypothetical protein
MPVASLGMLYVPIKIYRIFQKPFMIYKRKDILELHIVPCWRYLLGITDSATQSFTLFIPDFTVGITITLLRTQELSN